LAAPSSVAGSRPEAGFGAFATRTICPPKKTMNVRHCHGRKERTKGGFKEREGEIPSQSRQFFLRHVGDINLKTVFAFHVLIGFVLFVVAHDFVVNKGSDKTQ
jgi:hypothetical protein